MQSGETSNVTLFTYPDQAEDLFSDIPGNNKESLQLHKIVAPYGFEKIAEYLTKSIGRYQDLRICGITFTVVTEQDHFEADYDLSQNAINVVFPAGVLVAACEKEFNKIELSQLRNYVKSLVGQKDANGFNARPGPVNRLLLRVFQDKIMSNKNILPSLAKATKPHLTHELNHALFTRFFDSGKEFINDKISQKNLNNMKFGYDFFLKKIQDNLFSESPGSPVVNGNAVWLPIGTSRFWVKAYGGGSLDILAINAAYPVAAILSLPEDLRESFMIRIYLKGTQELLNYLIELYDYYTNKGESADPEMLKKYLGHILAGYWSKCVFPEEIFMKLAKIDVVDPSQIKEVIDELTELQANPEKLKESALGSLTWKQVEKSTSS